MPREKLKSEDEKSAIEPEETEAASEDLEETPISDQKEECEDGKESKEPAGGAAAAVESAKESDDKEAKSKGSGDKESKEKVAEQSDNPFSKLDKMRSEYSGFKKDDINTPDEAEKKSTKETLKAGAQSTVDNTADIAEKLMDESTGKIVGGAIKASYSLIKKIIAKVKGSKDKDEEQIGEEKSLWQKFKDQLMENKETLKSIGDKILGKIPFVRSIWSAIKTVYKIVQFFVINSTRKRMVENRRKFKDKYRDKEDKGGKFVEKSSGFMSWAKQAIGVKKTDETVNKDMLEKRYKGGPGTKEKLEKSETKDVRQYLIDDRLMKLNKERQIKKGKDAAFDGLDTAINVMQDVSFVASMGASEIGMAAVDGVREGLETGKEIAEKAIDLAELATTPAKTKEAVEYTGIMLEHIGEMTPFSTEPEVLDEYDHVDSDLEATGVDKMELYKKNGKKKEQKKLLVEALSD